MAKKAVKGTLTPRDALIAAGAKPPTLSDSGGDNRSEKKNWAQRYSNELALVFADGLRGPFDGGRITPFADGKGQEFSIGGAVDRKKTDVGVWDDAAGLVAGISIKTYTFRDTHQNKETKKRYLGRYSRNVKRNDMELRDEADTLHRRQPYAVLTALFFMNEDACYDGITGNSSFASAVLALRKRTGRATPDSRFDLFEDVYVGIVDSAGDVMFFDVHQAPRKNQPPPSHLLLSYAELIKSIEDAVSFRNTGVRPNEKFAEDDPDWEPPAGALPEGLENEAPLTIDDIIESAGDTDEDLQVFGQDG
jgi:hypothetical protein